MTNTYQLFVYLTETDYNKTELIYDAIMIK